MESECAEAPMTERQLYEDLSSLILTFKKLSALAQSVAVLIEKGEDHSPSLLKIKSLLQSLDPLRLRYESISACNFIQANTFYRFICRLLEAMVFLRGKAQSRTDQPHFAILNACFQQIETSTKRCKESKELFRLIKIMQLSFLKFCINCRPPASAACLEAQPQVCFNQLKLRIIKEKTLYGYGNCQRVSSLATEMDESCSEDSDSRSEKGCKKQGSFGRNYHFRTEYSKELSKLQVRFDSLKHLDLDYSAFRSDYFLAKANQALFFREYCDKNNGNRRIITSYYDDFHLFQKKRSQKEIRRGKYKQQSYMSKFDSKHLSLDLQHDQCHSNEDEQSGFTDLAHAFSREHIPDEQGTKSLDYDNGKKQLKMKSVQITLLSMGKGAKKYKIQNTFHKHKSRLQPISISQSYYNDLESNTKNSLDFLHRKLRIEINKKANRAEQEGPGKQSETIQEIHSLSQISKQRELLANVFRSRSSFKGKYLEVNCKGARNAEAKEAVPLQKITTLQKITNLQKITLKNTGSLARERLIITNQQS